MSVTERLAAGVLDDLVDVLALGFLESPRLVVEWFDVVLSCIR